MPNITLSEARVKALRPRLSAYDIRDAKLKGFGVRVLPSGVDGCVKARINGAQRREFVAITGTDDDSERWVGV